jgi:hypothetical protein
MTIRELIARLGEYDQDTNLVVVVDHADPEVDTLVSFGLAVVEDSEGQPIITPAYLEHEAAGAWIIRY